MFFMVIIIIIVEPNNEGPAEQVDVGTEDEEQTGQPLGTAES